MDDRIKMWNPEFSITESDAAIAVKNDAVKSLRVEQEGRVYHVFIQLTWRKEELFLSTTRVTSKPRDFHHVGRLVEYIEANYPSIGSFDFKLDKSNPSLAEETNRVGDKVISGKRSTDLRAAFDNSTAESLT